ncbi:MAG: type VII toxin-antitoxin system HepT family RNase toxin [Acidimicrobiales bacterium]
MVDERRVVRLLEVVTDELAYLHARAAEDRGPLRRDVERLSGLRYRFITAIEGIVNVAHHLGASEGWGPPVDNGDAVRALGRHGVLERQLADRLVRAVGFRNLLVHRYVEIDDDRVVAFLDELGDLDAFVEEVAAWLRPA